jgi:hypothetical protein
VADAALDRRGDGEAGVAKDVEHAAVGAEHIRVERVYPTLTRDVRQTFQQPGTDAVPLQVVGHGERHFRTIRMLRIGIEPGKRDDAAARLDDEGRRHLLIC